MPPKRTKNAKIEDLPSIELYAIYITEQHPNSNDKPIEWMLITNIKIDNNKKAIQAIDWYQKKWQIENFHRILKSGCKIEYSKLATYEKLKKIITIKSIIAYRLLFLTHINRNNPCASCDTVLSRNEWQALVFRVHKTLQMPQKPPSVSEIIIMLAKLGGFLNRKNDGFPGMTHICKGWHK